MNEIFIPILRSFESDGNHYIYGYSAIFDSEDAMGTVMSKQLVDLNIPRLKKFPTVRFQHREPLGTIVFDQTVDGIRTYTDQHGFHVLVKIYSTNEKEFRMIQEGKFGFSYGLIPTKTERQTINGKNVEVFTEGTLYEISVVDSPAHPEAQIAVLRGLNTNWQEFKSLVQQYKKGHHEVRLKIKNLTAKEDQTRSVTRAMLLIEENLDNPEFEENANFLTETIDTMLGSPKPHQPPPKRYTLRGFDVYEIHEDGSLTIPEKPKQRSLPNPNLIIELNKQRYPEKCGASCEYSRHCSAYPKNAGNPCINRYDLMRNDEK